ncbi:phage minor head protein [Escherichia coli]|uniref:phage minor head protein n=1 Tax=Escherichia coli TaxID=562 RepID=UPI0038CC1990
MTQGIDLGYAATLPSKEAVAYFRAKGAHISWNWFETAADVHARSFTAAKAARLDVLTTLQAEVQRAIDEGISQKEFIRTLTPRLQKLGWWGKQIVVDSAGNAEQVQLGSPRRLALIYNVNTRVAYNAGRYTQMMNNTDTHPFWQYVAVIDSRTRPEHAKLHLLVFRFDDVFWQTHYPPNDWECRCRVRALSAARMKAMGLKVSYGASHMHTREVDAGTDKASGELFRTTSTTFDNGRVKMTPGVGWSYNPGSAAFGTDQALIRKLIEVKSPALREMVVQEMNNSPERQLAFRIWAKNIMKTRRGGHDIRTLGFMTESIAQAVESRTGTPPARLLAMSGKNVLHADSVKHQNDGVALTPEDFGRLPVMLATPKAVLWDKRHNNLMYIVENQDGSVQIAVNAPYSLKRQPDKLDVIVNAYRVINMDKLKSDIRGGMLEVLEGQID